MTDVAVADNLKWSAVPSAPELPVFKPRFWFKPGLLDARPVAWSLVNRPEDWRWGNGRYTILHIPSKHEFWVSNGPGYYYLYSTERCSCEHGARGKFQKYQQKLFHKAFVHWQENHAVIDRDQFASHFIR